MYISGEYKGRKFLIDFGNILFCVGIQKIFFCDLLFDLEEKIVNIFCDWIVL